MNPELLAAALLGHHIIRPRAQRTRGCSGIARMHEHDVDGRSSMQLTSLPDQIDTVGNQHRMRPLVEPAQSLAGISRHLYFDVGGAEQLDVAFAGRAGFNHDQCSGSRWSSAQQAGEIGAVLKPERPLQRSLALQQVLSGITRISTWRAAIGEPTRTGSGGAQSKAYRPRQLLEIRLRYVCGRAVLER